MRQGLFDGLLDDAAIFPPGNAPMPVALAAHAEYGTRWYRDLVGPFVVPAGRLDELPMDASPGLSVIVRSDGVAAVMGRAALKIEALEIVKVETTEQVQHAVAGLAGIVGAVATFVEVGWTANQEPMLDTLAGTGVAVKLRTGGTVASAFPTEEQLAATLVGCVRRGIPVKCTAGLHHAVRHTETGTGFENHGFLNVLVGVSAALDGARAPGVAGLLADRDARRLAAAVADWDGERVAAVRTAFRSFGTCSISEPVEDLVALGLLTGGEHG